MMPADRNQKGQVLIGAVFVLIIVTILAMIAATMISTGSFSAAKSLQGLNALNVAEAGAWFTIATSLAAVADYRTFTSGFGPVSFAGGSFLTTYPFTKYGQCTVEVVGTLGGISRTVRLYAYRLGTTIGSIAQRYVIYVNSSLGGSSQIKNNLTTYGDVYVNGDLDVGNNVYIFGNAYATGNITIGTGYITGEAVSNKPLPSSLPTLDATTYNDAIAVANAITANNLPFYILGAKTFTGTVTPGAYYVKGNVVMGTTTLTGTTTITCTGTFTGSSTIGNNLTVTAGGAINLSGNLGSNDKLYSATSITYGADAGSSGTLQGSSFVTPGNVSFGNNVDFYGFIYCGGGFTAVNDFHLNGLLITSTVLSIKNNPILTKAPVAVEYDAIVGISGSDPNSRLIILNWQERY